MSAHHILLHLSPYGLTHNVSRSKKGLTKNEKLMKPSEIFFTSLPPPFDSVIFLLIFTSEKSQVKWPKIHQVIFCVIKHTHTLHKLHYGYNFWNFFDINDDFWDKKWNILKAWQRTNFEFLIFFTAEVGNKLWICF